MNGDKNPKNKPVIQITYSEESGLYHRAATSLASAIETNLGFTAKLEKTPGGIFEVTMGDNMIFTKCPCRPFPPEAELLQMVKIVAEDGYCSWGPASPSGGSGAKGCCC